MPERFLSSDDYDEHAHQLYNEGRFDEALDLLREGLQLYPNAVELHVGLAYAYLAREDYAWARQNFERALALDPDHEDTLAGYGEVLLKLGQRAPALAAFDRILSLGFREDHELMLQIGRALFREGLVAAAQQFFEYAVNAQPDCPEAAACVGYACHRINDDSGALYWLRRALQIDPQYSEARIYLANMLYDRGESEAAMHHLHQTVPEDHFDELGIWRYVELKKTVFRLREDDPELRPWHARLLEVSGEPDPLDTMLAEVEALQPDGTTRDPTQLELFGTLLTELQAMQKRPLPAGTHTVATLSGRTIRGTWDEILDEMKRAEREWADAPLSDFMADLARRGAAETGVVIPTTDAEAFMRGSARAGVVRIIQ
ncbi:MAG: tetratricopeptide repeat protein [Gemmatimonadales bacterium]|jgi:tetratricopeptide (TPR) repeat protein|nr:tetratricopeptide repeat protein [Gemmatimonadales bacterium]MBP9198478.1 tetratricopeptide repeat protein [Gemmatimonadales bacterium]